MAMPPRRTAGRRRRMTEGRKRFAALALSATLVVSPGSIPAAAGSEQVPACNDQPAGTRMLVDGREVICQSPTTDGQTGTQGEQGPGEPDEHESGAGEGDQSG